MLFAFNKKRKRRSGKRASSRRRKGGVRRRRSLRLRCKAFNGRRRRSHNGSMSMRAVTSAFDVGLLSKAGVVVGGSLANNLLTGALTKVMPISALKSGIGNYAVGLLSAGLIGIGARKVLPSQAGGLFFGAILDVVTRIASRFIVPMLPSPKLSGYALADYLTMTNVQDSRLYGMEGDDDGMDGFGDYATVSAVAAARPLNGLGYTGEMAESEELSGY